MKEIISRLAYNIFGLAFGYIVGRILLSAHIDFIERGGSDFFLLSTSLIGLIVSIALVEFDQVRTLKTNNLLRNEAISLISHEMRTGLTSAGWAIESVLQKYSDKMAEDDKMNLKTVMDSIHTTVIHSVNLLDISVLDLNKLSLSLKWMTLGEIEEIFNQMQKGYIMQAEKRGITFTYNITLDKDRQIEADLLRLKIILQNLLENAFQYTINEKKLIELTVTNTNNNLEIKISDSGIGIPAGEQEKIFGEFFRASNARTKIPTGSGIGLHACAQYVKAHRGTIRFESKENEGTTFYVTIPLKTKENIDEFMKKV